jgi:hypothetical protein
LNKLFIFAFSSAIGSIVMIILNLIFYGNTLATGILAASTALNCAMLWTFHREETVDALKRIFWRK